MFGITVGSRWNLPNDGQEHYAVATHAEWQHRLGKALVWAEVQWHLGRVDPGFRASLSCVVWSCWVRSGSCREDLFAEDVGVSGVLR